LFFQIRRLPNGEEKEVLAVGLACSECFSGPNLYKVLKPGLDFEQKVMSDLLLQTPIGTNGEAIYAPSLSIHTSAGLPDALETFLNALEPHLPWKKFGAPDDWTCSLQLEGASAVWAAIDMCLQVAMIEDPERNKDRIKVAVGKTSYHGPPSTSFGGSSPLWQKHYQIHYPTPVAGEVIDEEALFAEFTKFLDTHGDEIGVILIEPQWGSSQAALPWPKTLVLKYIQLSKSRGIKVVCDEIMCGLGRHGHGTFFASEAWDLDPDAVTFGKAIAGGCFQLSGAVLKTGRDLLASKGKSVMQSHTYAGSSTRALMTATEVLTELPKWYPTISQLGVEMGKVLQGVEDASDGLVMCHGQGLMWGGLFRRNRELSDVQYRNRAIQIFKKHCDTVGILPYHVPCGGFMLSPVLDINVGTIYEIGERLKEAIVMTKEELGWTAELTTASSVEEIVIN
jgi:adenosylmethionine-8-amino-7-oxononanoate aminotransferase